MEARKMSKGQKKWKELPREMRARFVVQGIVQFVLLVWVLWDLRHRPENKIKGSKRMWTLLAFVQPVGPIAYLLFGRRK